MIELNEEELENITGGINTASYYFEIVYQTNSGTKSMEKGPFDTEDKAKSLCNSNIKSIEAMGVKVISSRVYRG